MRPPKKPPPDTVGNVRGRMGALRLRARQSASVDAREGVDKMRALGKHMKEIEPELKKLQRRLERARKLEGAAPAPPEKKRPEEPKKAESSEVGDEEPGDRDLGDGSDDFLAKLDSL